MIIYCIGSLKNPAIPEVAIRLRQAGHEAFDDWWSSSEDCDDWWQAHEEQKGRSYLEAIYGYHATNVYEFDKHHLDRCDTGVLVMPAGRSGHAEFGYLIGCKKPAFVLWLNRPERLDVMHRLSTRIVMSIEDLIEKLSQLESGLGRRTVDHAPWNA